MPTRTADWAGLLLLLAAVALPAEAASAWLHPVYETTSADLVLGMWLLKGSLMALGIAAPVLARFGHASAPPPGNEVTLPKARAAWQEGAGLGIGIALLAFALRLWRLDTELWLDEILMLVRYIPLEFRQVISTYDTQNHHPLFTILSKVSYLLAGNAEWALRLPAVAFGVASIVAMRNFAARLTTETEGNLTALVLAVSYHHVWFSQNARGYTGILFLTVVATAVFLRLADAPGGAASRLAWYYGALMALAAYTNLTAALVAVGHGLALLLTVGWRRGVLTRLAWPSTALALSALLTVALYAPMLPQVVRKITEPTLEGVEVEWTSLSWMLEETIRSLSGGVPGGLPVAIAAGAALMAGVGSLARRSALATLSMFAPVVVTGAALVSTGHNLWPRFFFFAAGFFVLAAIRGGFVIVQSLVRWRPRRVATAGAVAVSAISLMTVPRAWEPKQQFRAAYDFVESEAGPDDAVVAVDIAFYTYLLRGWAPDWYLSSRPGLLRDVESNAARTWVVYTLPTRLRATSPELWEQLQPPRYATMRVFPATLGGGEILVLRHDRTQGHD